MKIFKKAAALFVAAAISITTALSAFAQASDSPKTENTIDTLCIVGSKDFFLI